MEGKNEKEPRYGMEGKGRVKGEKGPGKVLPALMDGTNSADLTPWTHDWSGPLLSTLPLCLGHQCLLPVSLASQLLVWPPHPQPTHSVPASRASRPFYMNNRTHFSCV